MYSVYWFVMLGLVPWTSFVVLLGLDVVDLVDLEEIVRAWPLGNDSRGSSGQCRYGLQFDLRVIKGLVEVNDVGPFRAIMLNSASSYSVLIQDSEAHRPA
ncbi:hypothetical protein BDW74DRAFT_153973 [Aspergillus multicolor]|uniref:uncharacterized protein n=1 Tax=Aspergillus multicolor TaxID=41759 RepID=UPI003CCD48A4